MNKEEYKAYMKAWHAAHREEEKAKNKAYYEAHKEEAKAKNKAYYEANKEEVKAKKKAYSAAHKDERKASMKAWQEAHKEECKAYKQSDVNSLGQTKDSIRHKSMYYLKKSGIKIPGYQIHHCFGYEDPNKFIYISKALHLKIHQYLRDNNIDAGSDHWMAIRDLVNSTDEFWYIKS